MSVEAMIPEWQKCLMGLSISCTSWNWGKLHRYWWSSMGTEVIFTWSVQKYNQSKGESNYHNSSEICIFHIFHWNAKCSDPKPTNPPKNQWGQNLDPPSPQKIKIQFWDFLPKKSSQKIPNSSSWVHGPRRARAPRASRTGSLGANGIGFWGWFIWDHFWENALFEIISMRGQEFVHCFCWGLFGLLWGVSFGDGWWNRSWCGRAMTMDMFLKGRDFQASIALCVTPIKSHLKNGEKSVTWRWMGWTCLLSSQECGWSSHCKAVKALNPAEFQLTRLTVYHWYDFLPI